MKAEGPRDQEAPMITPFLALVLTGYGVFMLILGVYSTRSFLESAKAPRKKD